MLKKELSESIITTIQSDLPVITKVINISEFVQFAQWFATPKVGREYKTQKAFAEAVGVCEDSLTDWKRHPQFWPLVQKMIGEQMKENVPDIIESLYDNAVSKGGASEVGLYLKIAGLINPNNK